MYRHPLEFSFLTEPDNKYWNTKVFVTADYKLSQEDALLLLELFEKETFNYARTVNHRDNFPIHVHITDNGNRLLIKTAKHETLYCDLKKEIKEKNNLVFTYLRNQL